MNIYKELRKLAVKMDADVSNAHQIKDLIRAMSAKLDGNSNGAAIADAVKNYTDVYTAEPNLHKLTVDVNVPSSEDLLGKTIGQLQRDVSVDGDVVAGTLYFVDDYTGFGSPDEQKGNFLVVHASVPGTSGVTIKVTVRDNDDVKGRPPRTTTLDEDGIFIFRTTNVKKQTLTFTASKEGFSDFSRTYSLFGLTCQKNPLESLAVDVDISTSEDFLGKYVTDLQSDVSMVKETTSVPAGITGKLIYVDDYTGFSSDPDLQKGHFLITHADILAKSGVTIKQGVNKLNTLDADGICITRITDISKPLVFEMSKDGYDTVTKTYDLSKLKLLESV